MYREIKDVETSEMIWEIKRVSGTHDTSDIERPDKERRSRKRMRSCLAILERYASSHQHACTDHGQLAKAVTKFKPVPTLKLCVAPSYSTELKAAG